MNRLRSLGPFLHPLLFTLFPVLSFFSANQNILLPGDRTLRSLFLLNLFVAALLWGVPALIMRDWRRAGLFASPMLLVFFSYGYVVRPLPEFGLPVIKVGPDKIVGFIILVGAVALFRFARRLPTDRVRGFSKALSIGGAAIVLVTVFTIIRYEISRPWTAGSRVSSASGAKPALAPAQNRPDIYYIVLDAYPRQDILKKVLHYDNSRFMDALRKRGFYIADHGNSNYAHTFFSLPSTLNMRYLNDIVRKMGPDSRDTTTPRQMIVDAKVIDVAHSLGYRYVNVGSGWFQTASNPHADIKFGSSFATLKLGPVSARIDETSIVYLLNTALKPIVEPRIGRSLQEKVLGAFAVLEKIPSIRAPTFTFAHITIPHPPLLFDAKGRWVDNAALEASGDVYADQPHFVEQLRFTNHKALRLIDKIFQKSDDNPPIVVLASDHGSPTLLKHPNNWTTPKKEGKLPIQERMGNLDAIYFPDRNYERLYPTWTPVNTFRLIFSQYFGLHYPLLPDRSYFSNYKKFYKLYNVTSWTKLTP